MLAFLDAITDAQASLIQTGVIVMGGLWALYLYRRRREAQPTIQIAVEPRLMTTGAGHTLFLAVRLQNASNVVVRNIEAQLAVFDASRVDASGHPIYLMWDRVPDVLQDVEGRLVHASGQDLFEHHPPTVWEPRESLATEVALTNLPPGRMAVKIEAFAPRGAFDRFWQRTRHPRTWGVAWWKPWDRAHRERLSWVWATFLFIE